MRTIGTIKKTHSVIIQQSKFIECDECNGTGIVEFHDNEGDYTKYWNGDCPECDGNGELPNKNWDDDNDE